MFQLNSFYTGAGEIIDDAILEELNNDSEKTEVSTRGILCLSNSSTCTVFQAQCLLHVGCRVASILCSKLCYQLWYLFVVNLVEVNLTASKCSPNWKTIPTVKFCEWEDLTECQ